MAVAWTPDQKRVIDHRSGNLLVSAAAGSGKTAVLIERLVQILMDPQDPVDVCELLVVTFTGQAAAQMRDKLYQRLGEALEATGDPRLMHQLRMLPAASIMTIHAFCLQCIRDYITRIEGLDPGFRIADETEAALMKADALEEILEESYGWASENPETEEARNFTALADRYSGSRQDQRLEDLVYKTLNFLSGIVDDEAWMEHASSAYDVESEIALKETLWYPMLYKELHIQLEKVQTLYQMLLSEYLDAGAACDDKTVLRLKELCETIDGLLLEEEPQWIPEELALTRMDYSLWREDPDGKKHIQKLVSDAREAVKEAGELPSQWMGNGMAQRMREQVYPALKGLQCLIRRFRKRYTEAKQDKNIVDFEDLERYALLVLQDSEGQPSVAARELRERYRYICIDEYQDSNDIQETLLYTIARRDEDGNPVNVFMVGDVKQSIYKFRQARPELFLEKQERYAYQKGASRIVLQRNFRSRAAVLEAVNGVFRPLMTKQDGELEYTEEEALIPGMEYPETDEPLLATLPRLTVLASETVLPSQETLKAEAEYTAKRIQTLVMEGRCLWDKEEGRYRSVRYEDIVILLRSMQTAAPVFQEALRRYAVPSYSEITSGFYQAKEVQCMVNILRIIDNPLQDIPLMGVLYSPIFHFTGHEMAALRLTGGRNEDLYHSLLEYQETGKDPVLLEKVRSFMQTLEEWREWASYYSIQDLLWALYQTTGYYRYASASPEGEYKRANLELLLQRAQEYAKGSYSGLFHFLRYIEKLEKQSRDDVEARIAGQEENVVRIMSIHKSKGLEFPAVFVCGTGRGLNMMDLREPVLFHQKLGIGTEAIDADQGFRYETLPHQAIMAGKRREALAEEMRVLYVAMTRPSEYLEVVGYRKREPAEVRLSEGRLPSFIIQGASCYLDWLEPVIRQSSQWDYAIQEAAAAAESTEDTTRKELSYQVDTVFYKTLDKKLGWKYPYAWKRCLPARMSVSQIKGQAEVDEDMTPVLFSVPDEDREPSGASVGTALHKALCRLDLRSTAQSLEIQLQQLEDQGVLSQEEIRLIPMEQLHVFARSRLAERMSNSNTVLREQPFIVQFTIRELNDWVPGWCRMEDGFDEQERVMVQGMIDCCFLEQDQWILVDYKSDRYLDEAHLVQYRRQLELYRMALEQISEIPVKEMILYQTRKGHSLVL